MDHTEKPARIAHITHRLPDLTRHRPEMAATLAFLFGRLFFSITGAVTWWLADMSGEPAPPRWNAEFLSTGISGALLGVWQRGDAQYYQQIAAVGYQNNLVSAFYPLYPVLGRIISIPLGNNIILGLVMLSSAAAWVSMWLLYKIAEEAYSPAIASQTLFYLLIFPATFFLYAIYPQSLLLMFVLLAYWLAKKGRWGWAGLSSLCAGLTHSSAAALSVLLGWLVVDQLFIKKAPLRLPMLLAPVMNIAGIAAFLGWRTWAGFPPYGELLRDVWQRKFIMPWNGLVEVVRFAQSLPLDLNTLLFWFYIFTFLIITFLTIWSFRRIAAEMWLFQAALLVMSISTTVDLIPLFGIMRYPLIMFPLFMELALLSKTRAVRLIVFSVFLLIGFTCTAFFFLWVPIG